MQSLYDGQVADHGDLPTAHQHDHSWLDAALIFRAFALAFSVKRIAVAFIALVASGIFGFALDAVWPSSNQVAYQTTPTGIIAEPELLHLDMPLERTVDGEVVSLPRMGNFAFFVDELRYAEDGVSGGVRNLSLAAIATGSRRAASAALWLALNRTSYAVILFLGVAAIWSIGGVVLARSVALALTRDDDIAWSQMRGIARLRAVDVYLAKLIPLGVVLTGSAALTLCGLVAAIPGIGELLYVVGFLPLIVGGGILMALAVVIGGAALPLMAYPVVIDGMDCADAAAAACSYVIRRPARYAFYLLVALIGGAILLTVLKLLVMLGLSLAGNAVASTMSLDEVAYSMDGAEVTVAKPTAIWTPPALHGSSPFYGTISDRPVNGWLGLVRSLIRLALMSVWALLAAVIVAYGYAAAGASYLLLRRSVDRADITELPLENADKDDSSAMTEL